MTQEKKFQNLPKNKKTINEEWTEQEVLEVVLLELSETASKHINQKTCNAKISISPLDKNIVNPEETVLRKRAISFLKSQKIIQDCKLSKGSETIILFDYSKNKKPEGKSIKMGVLIVKCKINPQKVIDYVVKIFEPKKLYCEKLSELYTKLIDIVETYLTKPIIRDKKLNNFYTILTKNIKEMIDGDLITQLRLKNWQPFTNLFSAEEEMEGKGVNSKETIQIMNAFLGEIYKFITLFDVKPNKEREKIKDLDDYLVSIRSQKRKERKELTSSKIEITEMPELKIKGLEEKIVLQKPKNKKIQLRKFPTDTEWGDITIKFLNGQEVIVKVKNLTFQTTYEEMGFQDEKRKLPNKQWKFLKGLSEIGGELSWKNPRATLKGKKQKQLLADTLKVYFQIDKDPFHSYKQKKSYKIKINLISEVGSENKQQDELEIKKQYEKQTPLVYDKYE